MTTATDQTTVKSKPSGPAAAALVAAGIGTLVLGVSVVLNELSPKIRDAIGVDFSAFFRFDQNFGLGSGVGPLSGKVIVSLIAYFAAWAILAFMWRGREVSVRRAFAATLVLVGLGFALTFPPIFFFLAGE